MREAFPRLFSLHVKGRCFHARQGTPAKDRYKELIDSNTLRSLTLEEVGNFDIDTFSDALKSLTLIKTPLKKTDWLSSATGLHTLSLAGAVISRPILSNIDFAKLPQLRNLRLHFMPFDMPRLSVSLQVTLNDFNYIPPDSGMQLSTKEVQSLVLDEMRYNDQKHFDCLLASLTTVKRLTIKDHKQSHIKIDAQPFPASLEYLSLEHVLLRDPTKIHAAKHLESLKLNLRDGDANILAELDLELLPKLHRLIIVGSRLCFPAPKEGVHFIREL